MASGHPSSCATATLGSVCHCECAGVRHSLPNDFPSGVKVAQRSTSDRSDAPNSKRLTPTPEVPASNLPAVDPTTPSTPTAPDEGPTSSDAALGPSVADLIDSDLPTGGEGSEAQFTNAERIRRQLADAMNGTFGDLTTEVELVEGFTGEDGEPGLRAHIIIRDADGNQVGSSERVLYRDADGNLVAYHELLQLNPEAQGRGFASAFNRHLEGWYRSEGVQRIELEANIDVGGYAWASHGYDFSSEYSAGLILERLRARLDGRLRATSGDNPAAVTAAEALLARAERNPFGSDGYPSAFEISQLGRGAGATDWLGRDVMLGSHWHGTRWL